MKQKDTKTTHKKNHVSHDFHAVWKTIQKDPKKKALFFGALAGIAIIIVIATFMLTQASDGVRAPFDDTAVMEEDETMTEETTAQRRLDGIIVAKEDANDVPVCVMIENAAFGGVRPQSGLSQALVVYEVIVEGGITRFMAVFGGEPADRVGPIRSARDTYLEFVSEYDCAYVHAGGSYTAMIAIPRFELRDIDALREGSYFYRDSSKFAPHNLFSSTEDLQQAVVDHSWAEETPTFNSWEFIDDQDTPGDVRTFTIAYGGAYDATYRYNEELNAYERSNGETPHTDANTGNVLTARNVVIQHVGEGEVLPEKGRINWPVTGEGAVEIYHDGEKFEGTWKKNLRTERTEFFDAEGNMIPLLRGNTWVQIVPPHIEVRND